MDIVINVTEQEKQLLLALLGYSPKIDVEVEDEDGNIVPEQIDNPLTPDQYIVDAFTAEKDRLIDKGLDHVIEAAAKSTLLSLKQQKDEIKTEVKEQGMSHITEILKSKI